MISSYVKLVTDITPDLEPVTLEEANAQSRLTVPASPPEVGIEDSYVLRLITACRYAIQAKIGSPIGEQVFEVGLGSWPYGGAWNWSWDPFLFFGSVQDYLTQTASRQIVFGPYGLCFEFPRPPLIALDSIIYTKDDGTVVTFYDAAASPAVDPGTFIIETGSTFSPGGIFLKAGASWPLDTLQNGYPIKMTFRAGIDPCPPDLKQAMLWTIAHMFENREPILTGLRAAAVEIPQSTAYLLEPYTDRDFR